MAWGAPDLDVLSSPLPSLLSEAPARFRRALKAAKSGDDLTDDLVTLARTAHLEQQGRQTLCGEQDRCACNALAREAQQLGGSRSWGMDAQKVRTAAQAACFVASVRSWLTARERMLRGGPGSGPVLRPTLVGGSVTAAASYDRPAYVEYDATRYDFRALVLRMLADAVPNAAAAGAAASEDAAASEGWDSLSALHTGALGESEPGGLGCAARWATEGLVYTKELDEATRYGCGTFNRIWRASPLRAEFLELYERFVAEVIAPHLGSPALVYQACPVFRVFPPGHLGVGPRHVDASYHRQPNELNFWVPLTPAHATNSLQVESAPGAADFAPITAGIGTMYRFRGNACEHFTELNVSDATRVSFDFRVVRTQELANCPVAGADDVAAVDVAAADESALDAVRAPGKPKPKRSGADEYFRVGRYYKKL